MIESRPVPLQLLTIRSAPAEDREAFELFSDRADQRPLTEEGSEQMAVAAAALVRQVPVLDRLAASPLLRGEQTAAIVAQAYGGLTPIAVPELSPGNPPMAMLRWLRGQPGAGCTAVVGHDPDLGKFLSWLLVGSDKPVLSLEPGAACLLEFTKEVGAGTATLRWSLTPAQLAALAAADP